MNSEPLHRRLSPQDYASLTDGARRRALQLRREAIRAFAQAVSHAVRGLWRLPSSTPLQPRT